jgi:uncharacterized protein (UPF0276 family)
VTLPDLGVGLVHLPGLGPLIDELCTLPDVIELEPQAFWSETGVDRPFQINEALLEQASRGRPALVHSVGFPVGGCSDGDPRQAVALRETIACLYPAWWSEHASLVWAGSEGRKRHLGFLMPPVQSVESVGLIADRIKRLQDAFGIPFAFETGVNYLQPSAAQLSDGVFWGAIADEADCGILLDLHNIWANAANGREPLHKVISELPLERVWEVHLAGGQSHDGYWLDSHSGLPPDGLIELASEIVRRLPNLHAVILEIIPDYLSVSDISARDIADCLRVLGCIWSRRGQASNAIGKAPVQPPRFDDGTPSMISWERSLEQALDASGPKGPLISDPGISVYRDLIAMARRGMIVETLPLSLRYLLHTCGEITVDGLFRRFWEAVPFQPFMVAEAQAFADFVRGVAAQLPHLSELLDFELAAHQAAITGRSTHVTFGCEPEPFFRSLMTGGSSLDVRPRDVSVRVTPPGCETKHVH